MMYAKKQRWVWASIIAPPSSLGKKSEDGDQKNTYLANLYLAIAISSIHRPILAT
jgi:hypothetical protein